MRIRLDTWFVVNFSMLMSAQVGCTSDSGSANTGTQGGTSTSETSSGAHAGGADGARGGSVSPGTAGGTGTQMNGGAPTNSGGAAHEGGAPSDHGGSANSGGSDNGGASGNSGASANSGAGNQEGGASGSGTSKPSPRVRRLLDAEWHFTQGDPSGAANGPAVLDYDAVQPWTLPTGNDLIQDPAARAKRPSGNLGDGLSYITANYDDAAWKVVTLPHDYAIQGPFSNNIANTVGALPAQGVAWYRKVLSIPASDSGKSIYLDIDGAMSYSLVWLNGQFVGGWPYGYTSFRLDLTPYVKPGADNVLAIRLDNPIAKDTNWQSTSSRWYAGAGIYRNVWLVTTSPVHVAQWGTQITTPEVSADAARVNLNTTIENSSKQAASVSVSSEIFELDAQGHRVGEAVGFTPTASVAVPAGTRIVQTSSVNLAKPKLWGTGANQRPNRYVAVTTVTQEGSVIDVYETPFGVRTIRFDPDAGFFLNGEHLKLNGVCMHHDLGALGAAVNYRALQRQLESLVEMGANALRTSHNPPSPELLELTDKMGILVMDETFDMWAKQKTELDYHRVFEAWREQDLRAQLRRDRNHPSVIMWSIGNEVPEQGDGAEGAALAKRLNDIVHQEDSTRPTISGMNSAAANSPFPQAIDAVGLNYQGSGVRTNPAQYPIFHQTFPDKFIVGTETESTVSTRGVYTFPVASDPGVAVSTSAGQDAANRYVSSYDLYFPSFGSSPDEEFSFQERYPFLGGRFVWTGWDYLGEPTPIDTARSSYFGIVDIAGFKKDRFYLYQANWRPDFPMVHILPHWTWPERVGQATPVHVYTSGDEAELFLNEKSLGRKKKAQYEYRLRWDDVSYAAGELRVVAYKAGREWATATVKTAGAVSKLLLTPDRAKIVGDGKDLSFLTLAVLDSSGQLVPRAMNPVRFEVSGPGDIVATDNGDPQDRTSFGATQRNAFNGLALAIVRAKRGQTGEIVVTARSEGLPDAQARIQAE